MRISVRLNIVVVLLLLSTMAMAQSFFSTKNMTFKEKGDKGVTYSAKIEFPMDGNAHALKSVREWICDMLETDVPKRWDESQIQALLRDCCGRFLMEA